LESDKDKQARARALDLNFLQYEHIQMHGYSSFSEYKKTELLLVFSQEIKTKKIMQISL
jgi:hypothetical protein